VKQNTFRLWATEHLVTWPNRLHLLAISLVGVAFVGGPAQPSFPTFGLILELCLVGSLMIRVWRWDRHRLDKPAVPNLTTTR